MTDASYRVKQVYFELVHCWTRLSVGMSWDWEQCGDSLYAAVFSLSSCHGHICPILIKLFAKSACRINCRSGGKKLGSEIYFNPSNREVFKGSFPELKGTFQNWEPASATKPLVIAAADDCQGNVTRLFQNWGPSLDSGKPPPTRWSRQRANDRYKDYLDGQLTIQWYSTGMLGFGTGTNVLRSVGKSIFRASKDWYIEVCLITSFMVQTGC